MLHGRKATLLLHRLPTVTMDDGDRRDPDAEILHSVNTESQTGIQIGVRSGRISLLEKAGALTHTGGKDNGTQRAHTLEQ